MRNARVSKSPTPEQNGSCVGYRDEAKDWGSSDKPKGPACAEPCLVAAKILKPRLSSVVPKPRSTECVPWKDCRWGVDVPRSPANRSVHRDSFKSSVRFRQDGQQILAGNR